MSILDQKYLDKEKELLNEVDRLKSNIDLSGKRLSVAVKNCGKSSSASNAPDVDHAETRAELSEESLSFFESRAIRADKITLQLNACIDVIEQDRKNYVVESLF